MVLVVASALVIVSACDKSTDPKPVKHGPYAFYMNGVDRVHPNYIYEYWPEADSLDTLIVDMTDAGSIAVSPDGKLIYVGTRDETAVVDLATDSVIVRLPYSSYGRIAGGIAASPDGRFLALAGEGFRLLDARSYEILYEDTGSFSFPTFDRDDDLLLVLQESMGIMALHANDLQRPAEYVSFEPLSVTRVLPLRRSSLWAVYTTYTYYASYLLIYSPEQDSVLHTEFTAQGHGDLCTDPSGRWLYFSVPGTPITEGYEPYFVELDLWRNFARKEISTLGIRDQRDTLIQLFRADYLAMTPDGSHLAGTRRNPGTGAFLIYDRHLDRITNCYNLNIEPNFTLIHHIAVQSRL